MSIAGIPHVPCCPEAMARHQINELLFTWKEVRHTNDCSTPGLPFVSIHAAWFSAIYKSQWSTFSQQSWIPSPKGVTNNLFCLSQKVYICVVKKGCILAKERIPISIKKLIPRYDARKTSYTGKSGNSGKILKTFSSQGNQGKTGVFQPKSGKKISNQGTFFPNHFQTF